MTAAPLAQSAAAAAPAFLLAWADIDPAEEDAFNEWYNHEHMRDRVLAVPGFLRGRRFIATEGGPRYLALYETRSSAVLTSEAYVSLIAEPDPKSRHFITRFQRAVRTIGRVSVSVGESEGAALALLPLAPDDAWGRTRAAIMGELLPGIVGRNGIVAAHLIERDEQAGSTSKRRHLRQGDRSLAAAILIESADPGFRLDVAEARLGPLPKDPAIGPAAFRLLYRVAPPRTAFATSTSLGGQET